MSLSTLLGVVSGLMLFVIAVALTDPSDPFIFVSGPSIMIVAGGTLASSFVSFEARYVMQALRNLYTLMYNPRYGRSLLNHEVGRIIRWGYVVQQKGGIALESEVNAIKKDDKLIGFGIELVVTGYTGDEVAEIMGNVTGSAYSRGIVQANILKSMAAAAPAFGMIGTLVGLIVMLETLGTDFSKLGSGLAVALITTLYGVLMAQLVFKPAANKVEQREQIRRFRNTMISEGLALLADRKAPRFIQDVMNSYLDPAIHFNIDQQMRQQEAGD